MPYYEVIFETGAHSVMYGENDDEVREALDNQQARALAGDAGGPGGQPAERIKMVYVYDSHPNEYNSEGTMSGEVALAELTPKLTGTVNVEQVAADVRNLANPVDDDALLLSRHNSQFKMPDTGSVTGSWSSEA